MLINWKTSQSEKVLRIVLREIRFFPIVFLYFEPILSPSKLNECRCFTINNRSKRKSAPERISKDMNFYSNFPVDKFIIRRVIKSFDSEVQGVKCTPEEPHFLLILKNISIKFSKILKFIILNILMKYIFVYPALKKRVFHNNDLIL